MDGQRSGHAARAEGHSSYPGNAVLTLVTCTAAPEITQLYALNIPAHAIRAKVREEFERNAQVSDIKAVDVLLLKGYQDLQETLNCWKMDRCVFSSLFLSSSPSLAS